jgi:hypothetical protein
LNVGFGGRRRRRAGKLFNRDAEEVRIHFGGDAVEFE